MKYNIYVGSINPYNLFLINNTQLDKVKESILSGEDFTISGKKYFGSDVHEFRIFIADEEKCTPDVIEYYHENINFRKKSLFGIYLPPKTLLKMGKEITDEIIGDMELGTTDKKVTKKKASSGKLLEIFISHSSKDVESAEKLILILRSALNLSTNQIRCTSVPGYKLKGGTNTDATLRDEIINCKVFIGMLSKNSINSTYVLFELGARWGNGTCLIPIVCEPNKNDIIKGPPLSGIHCIDGTLDTDIVQMINEIATELNIELSSTDVYLNDIRKFVGNSKKSDFKEQKREENVLTINKSDVLEVNGLPLIEYWLHLEEANKIIIEQSKKEWPNDYEMQEHYIENQLKAYNELQKLKPNGVPIDRFDNICSKATDEWGTDYEMLLYNINNQIESFKRLNNI